MMPPALRLQDLALAYRHTPVLRGLTGTFQPGSLTAVIGPNGAGKSTLLKGIIGLISPRRGSIRFDGARRGDIAYLPQTADLDRSFPITVLDLVSLGTWSVAGMFRRIAGNEHERVIKAINAVGLAGLENRVIGTLSGGQLQRALFARIILQDAGIVLLDEPFTAIDARTTADLLGLIHHWHDENRTVIAVLHDLEIVRAHFPETLLLAGEKIAWGPTKEVLTSANLLAARRIAEAQTQDTAPAMQHQVA